MDKEGQRQRSHLFTIHFWQEEVSEGQSEWRGKVHHVASGHVSYFRDWQKLVLFLQERLSSPVFDMHGEQEQN